MSPSIETLVYVTICGLCCFGIFLCGFAFGCFASRTRAMAPFTAEIRRFLEEQTERKG